MTTRATLEHVRGTIRAVEAVVVGPDARARVAEAWEAWGTAAAAEAALDDALAVLAASRVALRVALESPER